MFNITSSETGFIQFIIKKHLYWLENQTEWLNTIWKVIPWDLLEYLTSTRELGEVGGGGSFIELILELSEHNTNSLNKMTEKGHYES